MSFIGNLAKGFVRSTVNQVGRDTGKVISNKIYGNAHATPIKGICQNRNVIYDEIEEKTITESEFSLRLKNEGYKIKHFNFGAVSKSFMWGVGFLGTLLFCAAESSWAYVPASLLTLYAILKIITSYYTMDVYQEKDMPVYKSDLRYKDGRRFAGYRKGEISYEIYPTKKYKSNILVISIIYIFLAIIMYLSANYYVSIGDSFTWGMFLPLYGFITLLLFAMQFCFKYLD